MGRNKNYTEEFKREAVARSTAIGPTKASEELGISPSLIYSWRDKYKDSSSSNKKPSYDELEEEVKRLRKEIGYIEEINKVLKKSTAIFSSDHIKGSK